ncbi:hypothetical protein Tco_0893417 [Tanacetum coccineum]|uniref:Uncharacterized protein n=1 Tax=Tanacetum coccineum TaxID=301880 RepID=A0ABQ5C992_9ASTR
MAKRLRTASLTEFELKKILIDKIKENKSINISDVQKNLYNALIESYNLDKDILTSYGEVVTLKRGYDDQDKDEEPSESVFSFDESNTHVLERFYTSAGNPVKEILIKLNLPDHRKLKDGGEDPPFEEEILSFIRDLGHTSEIKVLSDVNVNHLHQPWRSFAAIINKCLNGKTTALESLRLSRAQILWGMYHNKNVDYVYLLWEDLVYQVENKNSKTNNDMYYPRFTKIIVDNFLAKDQAIPRRNKMFWHNVRDDLMFTTITPSILHVLNSSGQLPRTGNDESRRKQRKDNGPTKPILDEATNEEHVSTPSNDPPQRGEDRLQLTELMSLCTSLQEKVLDLEKAKTAQAKEIASLKKRVKQLEKRKKSITSGLKRGIADLDADAEVTLIDETQERNDEEMLFDVQDDLQGKEVVAEKEVVEKEVSVTDLVTTAGEVVITGNVEVTTSSAPTTTIDELTLAQTSNADLKQLTQSCLQTTALQQLTTKHTRPKDEGL